MTKSLQAQLKDYLIQSQRRYTKKTEGKPPVTAEKDKIHSTSNNDISITRDPAELIF